MSELSVKESTDKSHAHPTRPHSFGCSCTTCLRSCCARQRFYPRVF